MVTHDTIDIYRLAMRNLLYDDYFTFSIFRATFDWKMYVAITRAPNGLQGPQKPPKKLPTGWTLWANRYLKNMLLDFSEVTHAP